MRPDPAQQQEDEMPKLIFKMGRVECWEVDGDFYVYGVLNSGDPRVCPSESMARDVAASAA